MPLTFQNPEDYDKLEQGHDLSLSDIESGMELGTVTMINNTTGATITLNCAMTQRQRAILMAGGLLNYTKEGN